MTTPAWMGHVIEQYDRAMHRIGAVWLWDQISGAILGPARRRRAEQLHELADLVAEISPSQSAELHKLADQ